MKITEVIKVCDTLCPNEYTQKEKLLWCDELGAILTREHSKNYRIENIVIENGRYALPNGVLESEIERIIVNSQLIKKSDAAAYGLFLMEKDGRVFVLGDGVSKDIRFLLRPGYEHIRAVELCGAALKIEGEKITAPFCPFVVGDALLIEVGEDVQEVIVNAIEVNADGSICVETDNKALPQGECYGDIKRIITDETVCSAPFDAMYYDFVNAKICFHQRDYDSYNHHMALFNSRLEDYDRYMIKSNPSLKDSRVTNWWTD